MPTTPRSRLQRIEDTCLVLLVSLLLLLVFAQILLRNVGVTWIWTDPVVRHLVLWTSFLGALIATRDDGHIRIDAGLRLLPPTARHLGGALSDVVAAVICLLLTPPAVRFVMDEHTFGGDLIPGLPRWLVQLVFPLVFGGMAIRFSGRAWRQARRQGQACQP